MYTYRLTPSAKNDLLDIRRYIGQELQAPDSAERHMAAFEQAFREACRYPLSLPLVNDPALQAKGYRKIIVKNYVAFVLIDQEHEFVDIMRVLYYARNYQKLL